MTPDWFNHAVAQTPQHHTLSVLDAAVHYQTWNVAAKERETKQEAIQQTVRPGLLFVHGHGAHAHWWDFIAPSFSRRYQVGALDMSGNGDSDHRAQYRASQFAAEIVAVAKRLGPNTTLVAHSFGGSMARIAAYLHPGAFQSLILVDSVINRTRRQTTVPRSVAAPRVRFYPTLQEAKRRFRLRPPQPRPADYIQDYLAKHSVHETPDGYQFKLDPQVFDKFWPDQIEYPDAVTMIENLQIPTAYIYGELSRFCPPEALQELASLFPGEKLKMVAAAYHHVFLDQPEAFIDILQEMLPGLQAEG
ncbi:MAG: pimeloyl-ACP methyl ester carboxylesterase [Candidatus Azotimanducaceae bacterium]